MATLTLTLTTIHNAHDPLEEVAGDVLDALFGTLSYYEQGDGVVDHARAVEIETDEEVGLIHLRLPEDDPRTRRALGWLSIGLSMGLGGIDAIVTERGWALASPRDDVPAVFDAWVEELAPESTLRSMVGPDESFVEAMTRGLAEEQGPDVLASLAWYIGNVARPNLALVENLIDRCERTPTERFITETSHALERLARRIDLGALLEAKLTTQHPVAHALASRLVPQAIERGTLSREDGLAFVMRGMSLEEPASNLAAEMLPGLKLDAPELVTVRDLLIQTLQNDPPVETLHNALLALINLHLSQDEVPAELVETFAAHTDAPTPINGLASWAVQVFSGRVP